MSTPIRLLISDVDGTLVRCDKSLSDTTVAAFVRSHEAGIAAALISGCSLSGMVRLAEALGIDHLPGAFNGGTILIVNGAMQGQLARPSGSGRTRPFGTTDSAR